MLCSKFGIAAKAAQIFEIKLGSIALCAQTFNEGWHTAFNFKAATEALRDIDGGTLGRPLGRVSKELTGKPSITDQFTRALEDRSRLFHGLDERHDFKIWAGAGRDAVTAGLDVMEATRI